MSHALKERRKEGTFPLNNDYSLTQAKIPLGHLEPPKATEWYFGFSYFKEPCPLTPKFSMGRGQKVIGSLQPPEILARESSGRMKK